MNELEDWQLIRTLYNKADELLYGKIAAARRDIHQTCVEMGRIKDHEIYQSFAEHLAIMKEYVEDLNNQREILYYEYTQERTTIAGRAGLRPE